MLSSHPCAKYHDLGTISVTAYAVAWGLVSFRTTSDDPQAHVSTPHDDEAVTMRFLSLPASTVSLALLHLAFPPCITAQFVFPPPLNGSLSDYTSGKATPTMNFSAGDNMFGGWSTPGQLMSFLVYRCTGSTAPGATIKSSNSEFNSTEGHLAPDKTWEQMPLYSGVSDMFGNGFNPGRNPIWFHGDFFANNKTTGDLCWFEL